VQAAAPVPAVAGVAPVAPLAAIASPAPLQPAPAAQEARERTQVESRWRQTAEEAIERARESLRDALRRGDRAGEGGEWRAELERALQELDRVRTQEFARVEREIERATREAQRAGEIARTRAQAGSQSLRGALGGLLGRTPAAGQRERSLEERVAELERRLEVRGGVIGTAPRDDRDCTPNRARVLVAPRAQVEPRGFGYVLGVGPDGEVSTEGGEGWSGEHFEVAEREGWRADLEESIEEAWEEARDAMDEVEELWEETFHEEETPQTDDPDDVDPEGRQVVFLAPEVGAVEIRALDPSHVRDLAVLGYVVGADLPPQPATPESGTVRRYALLGDAAHADEAASADADLVRALIADMQGEVEALRAELGALREELAQRRSRSSLR
jgi:hypothetical protein